MQETSSLTNVATAAKRRWIVIVAIAVLAAVVAAGISIKQPIKYQATSKVLIGSASTLTSGNSIDSTEAATQAQVVGSIPVATRVASKLGTTISPRKLASSVTIVTDSTRVLTIEAIASSKSLSVDIANGFAEQYLSYQQEKFDSQLVKRSSSLASLATQLQTTIATLDKKLACQNCSPDPVLSAKRQALIGQLTAVKAQQSALPSSPAAFGEVLLSAQSASLHSRVPLVRTAVLAGILGLLVGFGVALLLDRFDDRIHDTDGGNLGAASLPVLGRLPRWTSVGNDLISMRSPDSAASESFRQLGASLRSELGRLPVKAGKGNIVAIASPRSAEGKTEVAANLAILNASVGLSVVLVDANLRNRALSVRLKVDAVAGLSDVLVAPYPKPELVEFDEIQVLPAGSLSSNPGGILGSTQMAHVLDGLAELADLVIVDTPGTLQFADAAEIFDRADLVVIVCRAEKSTRRDVSSAVSRATALCRGPVGLVLNQTRNA